MAIRIVNINTNNVINSGDTVAIQLEDCNPVELFGDLSEGLNAYPLEHVAWDLATNIWTVRIPSAPAGPAYTLNVRFNDAGAVVPDGPSGFTYVLTMSTVIEPDYTPSILAKGASKVDPVTGVTLVRVSDASTDLQQASQAVNGYSRYSQENSNQTLIIVQGTNSTSSTIIEKATGNVVAYLAYDDTGQGTRTLGMAHEMRWDKTGAHPNRIYYRNGTGLYQIDDVTQNDNTNRSNPTRSLIKDFTSEITWPAAATGADKKIYNDQEGDCSLDCDHWAFMAAYYEGGNWRVCTIVHYQISTGAVHTLSPADLAGAPTGTYQIDGGGFKTLDSIKTNDYFPRRPNMVEVSPLGTGLLIHTGRSYAGWHEEFAGTWFDGAYLWPLDLNWAASTPFRICISETHSGWAWAADGRELFVAQDNRRDVLCATYIAGANKGYGLDSGAVPGDDAGAGTIDFAIHADLSYTGFHFAQMPQSKPGFILASTYDNSDDWADDQLIMFAIAPIAESPVVWRVSPIYSKYAGSYWDETPASMSLDGQSVYCSGNWGVSDGASNEVYRYELEPTWWTDLGGSSSVGAGGAGDTTAPVLSVPAALSIEFVNGGSGIPHNDTTLVNWLALASATDNVDGSVVVNNNLAALANPLPAASHTITFTTVDAAGNVSSATSIVTVAETPALGESIEIIIPTIEVI